MKPAPLWQVSISTSREAEEGAAVLLERLFAQPASSYTPDSGNLSVVTVYSAKPPEVIRAQRRAIQTGLEFLATCGLETCPGKIVIRKVPREDWTTSWKKYFKTIEVGSKLLIKPSWSKRKARPGQAVVTLDPGLSFGTGQHPTTDFCLKQVVATRKTGQSQAFLDIGTGSGILAIAAAKMGYAPIYALDNDATAVRVAKANARKNRVESKLTLVREALKQLSTRRLGVYDLICANLIQDLLLLERKRIIGLLRPGGRLVLAGLLVSQFEAVQIAYQELGLRLEKVRAQREWKSGAFLKAG